MKSLRDRSQIRLLAVAASSGEVRLSVESRFWTASRGSGFGGSQPAEEIQSAVAVSPDATRAAWQIERSVLTISNMEAGEMERGLEYLGFVADRLVIRCHCTARAGCVQVHCSWSPVVIARAVMSCTAELAV